MIFAPVSSVPFYSTNLTVNPLATAIVQGARERGLKWETATDFKSVTAHGVMARVGERSVVVGKPEFLRERKVSDVEIKAVAGRGHSLLQSPLPDVTPGTNDIRHYFNLN